MPEEKNPKHRHGNDNLEEDGPTGLQKRLEEKIAADERSLTGEKLSEELSKDRTHMSEHRTRMSEHRTGLSEHRTGLSEHRTSLSEKRTGLSDERTTLSYQRTALSYERTLMSWIRTATAMISFGFTIYKFFDEMKKEGAQERLFTPRLVGMLMIGFGLLSLLLAQVQHEIAIRKLKAAYPAVQRSVSSLLSILVLLFGLALFLGALFRQ